jgi:hypothetical protein
VERLADQIGWICRYDRDEKHDSNKPKGHGGSVIERYGDHIEF